MRPYILQPPNLCLEVAEENIDLPGTVSLDSKESFLQEKYVGAMCVVVLFISEREGGISGLLENFIQNGANLVQLFI